MWATDYMWLRDNHTTFFIYPTGFRSPKRTEPSKSFQIRNMCKKLSKTVIEKDLIKVYQSVSLALDYESLPSHISVIHHGFVTIVVASSAKVVQKNVMMYNEAITSTGSVSTKWNH